MQEDSFFSIPSPAFDICRHFDDASLTGVTLHLSLVLICISQIAILSIYSRACWPLVCVLWRSVYLCLFSTFLIGSYDFFFYIELYKLYILEINSLSVSSSANMFSHSTGCLVIFFLWFPLLCKNFKISLGPIWGFPGGSDDKESHQQCRRPGFDP